MKGIKRQAKMAGEKRQNKQEMLFLPRPGEGKADEGTRPE